MPNKEDSIFVPLLKACAKKKDLQRGFRLHDDIQQTGLLDQSIYLANTLISMYAKCGALVLAEEVLQEMPVRNVVALMEGCTEKGYSHETLNCFEQMQAEGLSPGAVTYTAVLKACGITKSVKKGKQIRDEIVRHRILEKDIMLGNALIDMYAKFGMIRKAEQVLGELSFKDDVSWIAVIAGHAQQGKDHDAFRRCKAKTFLQMQSRLSVYRRHGSHV